ncbi:SAM hydrolase/SAM-dependent halogenase family protein [Halobellus ruber]|uniref:SAM-dependent chlorinase/fluorinase n=1 Tax=Halobellus ruber TaxID=2761102 RepID=A0A7J9SIN2_9EURY|nr:SAM-dependent chlorinase/fluorinase [Halobellus ruber]MBB6645876.1 SAM-dependent chlorinase/fluorinase [Halobellus ruber]
MLTLTSDFGSPYPAAMKGVVLRRTDARLVDIAHDLPRQDVRAAAFWCRETLPYFPPAVHLVVVDPGVGTDRDAVVVRVGGHAIVAPDNGVALPAARRIAAEADIAVECFRYEYADPASSTFHGRDVFAPAAAAVHEVGVDAVESLDAIAPLESVAPDDAAGAVVDCRFPEAEVTAGAASGEVLVVDDFGNAITNVPGSFLDGREGGTLSVNGTEAAVVRAFADVDAGERLVTVGSHGFVECDVNRGRGADAFGLAPGDEVRLTEA